MDMPVEANETPAESPPPAESAPPTEERPGCGSLAREWSAGWALSWFSPTFYRHVTRQRLINAIGFLGVLALVLTGLQTISFLRGALSARPDIQEMFDTGEFPEVTIKDGVAEVSGPEPFVLYDDGIQMMVLDTTGTFTADDLAGYTQAFIMTEDSVLFVQYGQIQEVPLSEFHTIFNANPIVINADTLTSAWTTFTWVFSAVAVVFLLLWHTLVRLAYLALIGLVIWGVTALIRPGTGFSPVLVTGIYAVIPAMLLRFFFGQVGVQFPGLFTMLLVPGWAVALALAVMERKPKNVEKPTFADKLFRTEHPLRAWRALIAVPLFIDVALEIVFRWNLWYVTWSLAILTLAVLVAVSLWPLVDGGEGEAAAPAA